MLSSRFQDGGDKLKALNEASPLDGKATNETHMIGESQAPTPVPGSSTPVEFSPDSFGKLLKKLVLHPTTFLIDDASQAFYHLATPEGASPPQIGAFLSALRLTGKDGEPAIVAACAEVMQKFALPVNVGEHHGVSHICDIVGTGGDGQNTFNVSTTAGIVAAGAGCRVYKHGNKAATSSSGSADILLSLGCPVTTLPAESISSIASSSNFMFLYAPIYHPAMVRVAPIRRSLGFPTVFNALGPLINPARPQAMIVGVHSKFLGPIFAQALRLTGVKRAWVVCGKEGLDEISPEGESWVWELKNDEISEKVISPDDFGLPRNSIKSVVGGTPEENAATLHSLLDGELGQNNPIENFVVLNTAALLFVAGQAKNLRQGVELARESISTGKAKEALENFRVASTAAISK